MAAYPLFVYCVEEEEEEEEVFINHCKEGPQKKTRLQHTVIGHSIT